MNPQSTVCVNDAHVIAGRGIPGGVLQLVYSRNCAASWGRIVVGYDDVWGVGAKEVQTGIAYFVYFGSGGYSSYIGGQYYTWSPMVDGAYTNCAYTSDFQGNSYQTVCL